MGVSLPDVLSYEGRCLFSLITGDSDNSELCVRLVCEREANKEIDFCLFAESNSG